MKILTTIKRVADYEATLKIDDQGTFIDCTDINMISNPFDEIAVEAALRLKEKYNGEVIVVSIGDKSAQQNIRNALAMGADRGILILHDIYNASNFINTNMIAKILEKIVNQEKPDVIIAGKQSIDTDNHQVGEYLAELLNIGHASQANNINMDIDNKEITVIKEVNGGLETVTLKCPCLITADLRLNEPRYASLPGIMKAKRKPLSIINVTDLNVNTNNTAEIIKLEMPQARTSGIILETVDELMEKFQNDIKIF